MSPLANRLADAIERAGLPGVAVVLAPLDEARRAALAPVAADAFWRYLKMVTAGPGHREVSSDTAYARLKAASVAWLGTGEYQDFPPHRETGSPDWYLQYLFTNAFDTEELHQVLVDRRPRWLPALADRYLASCFWDQVHALVMAGVLPRPTSPAYLRGLATHAGRRRDLAATVDDDPAVLTVDLPALLDLPDGLLLVITNRFRVDRWTSVLTAHLTVGHALRDRILDGVLDLLAADRPAQEAAQVHQFLDALRPTPDELAARRRVLFTLVAQRQPGVVSCAVRALGRVARAGLVPPAELADAVEPALLAPAKSTAIAAVRLVTIAVRRDPGLAARALDRYLAAAGHPHPEVQLAAIDAAAPLLPGADDTTTAGFVDLLAELSPRAADRLRQAVPAPPAPPPTGTEHQLDETVRRAERLGLHAAVAAVRRAAEPPPVTATPWADAGPPVAPVSDVDELVLVMSQVIEGRAAPIDIERALDAVATVGPDRPADFDRRIGPLTRLVSRPTFPAGFPAPSLAWMVSVWLNIGGAYVADPYEISPHPHEPLPYQWLHGRIREVAAGSRDPDSGSLLALPTHPGGWLDPAVLVQRAAAAGPRISRPLDTAIALARLLPVDRSAALSQAAELAGPLGTAVRAALGGDDDITGLPPTVTGTITWLRGADHPGPPYWFGQPDPHEPPRESHAALMRRAARERQRAQPDSAGDVGYSLLQQRINDLWMYTLHGHRSASWAATQWPGDHRWLWWYEATSVPAMPLLLDPNEPMSSEALAAVIRHLDRDGADERTLAADVLASAIGDGRLTSASLGTALHHGIEAGVLPNRLAALLRAAATPSVLHRTIIRAALLHTVPAWPGHLPNGEPRYQLITLLDELREADDTGVFTPEARAALTILTTGRSKTATTARRLLSHPPTRNGWPPAALAAALASRIARRPDTATAAAEQRQYEATVPVVVDRVLQA